MKNRPKLLIACALSALFYLTASAQSKGFSISAGTNKAYYESFKNVGQFGVFVKGNYAVNRVKYGLNLNFFTIDRQQPPAKVGDIGQFYHLTTLQADLNIGYSVLNKAKFRITPTVGIVVERRNTNVPLSYKLEPNGDKIVAFNAQTVNKNNAGAVAGLDIAYQMCPKISLNLWSNYYIHKSANDAHPTLKTNYLLTGLGVGYHF